MKGCTVTATRVHNLWELDVLGVGVTQSITADAAAETVRDYLDCLGIADADVMPINIVWHFGPRAEARAWPIVDARLADDIVGYDEDGLPT